MGSGLVALFTLFFFIGFAVSPDDCAGRVWVHTDSVENTCLDVYDHGLEGRDCTACANPCDAKFCKSHEQQFSRRLQEPSKSWTKHAKTVASGQQCPSLLKCEATTKEQCKNKKDKHDLTNRMSQACFDSFLFSPLLNGASPLSPFVNEKEEDMPLTVCCDEPLPSDCQSGSVNITHGNINKVNQQEEFEFIETIRGTTTNVKELDMLIAWMQCWYTTESSAGKPPKPGQQNKYMTYDDASQSGSNWFSSYDQGSG